MAANTIDESYLSATAAGIVKPATLADSKQDDPFDAYPSGYALVSPQDWLEEAGPESEELRTIIAGPGAGGREDLYMLLASEPGVRVVADCPDSEIETVTKKCTADLLIVDLQDQVEGEAAGAGRSIAGDRPVVVCVASDPKYAIRAFELNAVDFLVRPVGQARLRQALERTRRELRRARFSGLAEQMVNLLQQSPARGRVSQLVFRTSGRLVFLDLDDIDWIEASANYVRLNANSESYLVRESIGRLSERLDRERFVRIHRSVIVNVRRIKELQSCNAGEYIAVLKSGKKLPCSRGFRGELERYISTCMQTANTRR